MAGYPVVLAMLLFIFTGQGFKGNFGKITFSTKKHKFSKIVINPEVRCFLWAMTASPYPWGLNKFILQPNNPNQFVNFRFVDRHFIAKKEAL